MGGDRNEGEKEKTVNFTNLQERVPYEYKSDVAAVDNKIKKGEPGIGKYYNNGQVQYLGFAPIKSKGWTLLIDIDEVEMLKGLNALKLTLFIAVFVSIIIGLVFSLLFSRNLTKPIVQVTEHSYKLAQLDLSEDMGENLTKRKDELGTLANSLQIVIENMRFFAFEIQESSHQVAAASQELSAIAEESTAAATHIAESSNQVAEGSNTQLEEILNIASSIQDISIQVENTAKATSVVENLSKDIDDNANLGNEKIDEVIVQMNNISNSTRNVKNSLKNINVNSNEINQILEIIQDVAEQTNLLALNAAIEAARAGEYGAGFAVVADEIRKLAEETQKSTEEIYLIIVNNNNLIEEANINMELGEKEVETGIIKVNETKESFDKIVRLIDKISNGIYEVAQAATEVNGHTNNLVNTSQSVENISKNIAAQIQNSSAASEEQMASMEEISSSTEALAKLAEELQILISDMKL